MHGHTGDLLLTLSELPLLAGLSLLEDEVRGKPEVRGLHLWNLQPKQWSAVGCLISVCIAGVGHLMQPSD